MVFLLVKEREIELKNPWEINGIHSLRTVTVPASIESTGIEGERLSENDCAQLKVLLDNFNKKSRFLDGKSETGTEGQSNEPLNWDLDVTFGLVFSSNENNRDFVRITGPRKNNILERLKSFLEKHQLKLKIAVKLQKFTIISCHCPLTTLDHVESIEAALDDLSSSNGAQLNISGYWGRENWNPRQACHFMSSITISCVLYPAATLLTSILFQKKECLIRKILKDELNSDAVIFAKNDVPIKCHKAFLSAQSTVFETMFRGEHYQESKTGTLIIMPDMTEVGVRAFLAYLYLRDDDKADENCSIALELLKAGHTYHVSALEESMKNIFLSKPDDWFEADVAMELFKFSRNLPDGNDIKMRAVKVLKKNFATLKTSDTYKQLLKEDPDAAMELRE